MAEQASSIPCPAVLPPRIFVASSSGIVPAWVMPGSAAPLQRRGGTAPPAVNRSIPRQRTPTVVRDERLVPPGRHARAGHTMSWRRVSDAALVLFALAVLLLAVVAVQQPV